MTFMRLALERMAVRLAQTNSASKVSAQRLHNSCLRWAQGNTTEGGGAAKGLSDLQRSLKNAPQPKLKNQKGQSNQVKSWLTNKKVKAEEEMPPRDHNNAMYYMGIFFGTLCASATQMVGIDYWIAHWESMETNTTMAEPPNRRKFARDRLKEDTETPPEQKMFISLNEKMMNLIQTEMEELELRPRTSLYFFQADSMEPVLIGHDDRGTMNHSSMMDSALGLPLHLCQWESVEEVDLSRVRQDDKYSVLRVKMPDFFESTFCLDEKELSANLTLNELQELKETFVLSTAAKRYAISRKLRELVDTKWKLFERCICTVSLLIYTYLSVRINDMGMIKKPLPARLAVYASLASLVTLVMMTVYTEAESDLLKTVNAQLKEAGHTAGAIEYLTKQIRRGELLNKGCAKAKDFVNEAGDIDKPFFTSFPAKETSSKQQLKFFLDQK